MALGDVSIPETSSATSQIFYMSSDRAHIVGDVLTKEAYSTGGCFYAVTNLSSVVNSFGFDRAVYGVVGKPCSHKWADNDVLYAREAQGGYSKWWLDEDDEIDPLGEAFFFDELCVIEVIEDSFFGPNGSQVLSALTKLRSCFGTHDSKPLPEFAAILKDMYAYYERRVSYGESYSGFLPLFTYKQKALASLQALVARERFVNAKTNFFLRPWMLTAAWNETARAAFMSGMAYLCDWLAKGSPALAALAVRSQISGRAFTEMYAPFERLLPLHELDSSIPMRPLPNLWVADLEALNDQGVSY